MRIKARYNAVVSRLRKYLGTSFLSDARFMIAYPKRTCAFMQYYRYTTAFRSIFWVVDVCRGCSVGGEGVITLAHTVLWFLRYTLHFDQAIILQKHRINKACFLVFQYDSMRGSTGECDTYLSRKHSKCRVSHWIICILAQSRLLAERAQSISGLPRMQRM